MKQKIPATAAVSATSIATVQFTAFAGRALLVGACATNESGSTFHGQFHDTAATIQASAAPKYVRIQTTNSTVATPSYGFPVEGMVFENGISFGWSSTRDTYTAAGAGTGLFVTIDYIPL